MSLSAATAGRGRSSATATANSIYPCWPKTVRRKAEMIGRRVGAASFIAHLELQSGLRLRAKKTGPKVSGAHTRQFDALSP